MLKVYFGNDDNAILDIDAYFKVLCSSDWFEDERVKQMIKDIDKSIVLSPRCIESPVLGQISPDWLSGGVKGLMCLLMDDEFYPDLVIFGNNCCEWIYKISIIKDIRVNISGTMMSFRDIPITGICLNDGSMFVGNKGWRDCLIKYV